MKLTIGGKIALLRKERNITQTELAEYLFLAPQAVSRWEVGSGAPDIALLPKIAAFFGVSIDELFGLTSLERTEDLAAKYSVLRDDNSFREAMEYIDSQLQSMDAFRKNGAEDPAGLVEQERDQLEAEKAHMWIQQGREAFQRAFNIVDSFVAKTEGKPDHPWYLRMRLQRDQLCGDMGKGREALEARKKDYMECPDEVSLLRYLAMLGNRQEYELLLSAGREEQARGIIFPPAEKNLPIWLELIHAAAKTGGAEFIEQFLPQVLEACGKEEELDFLMCLLKIYSGEKLAEVKQRICSLLPEASLNEFFKEKVRGKVEG